MFGDIAPIPALAEFLDKYDRFYLYVDDAHGTGCTGSNGSGYVLDDLRRGSLHPKALVTFSLSKALCAAGGGIVGGDSALVESVRMMGPGIVFSFTLTNPSIGAARAAIDICTSAEGAELRQSLAGNIHLLNDLLRGAGVPSAGSFPTPITYIPLGGLSRACDSIEALKRAGFYVNIAAFPAVPKGEDGIRVTVKATHTPTDLESFVHALAQTLGAS